MPGQIISPTCKHTLNRRNPRISTVFVFLGLLVVVSLSCDFGYKPREPVGQKDSGNPGDQVNPVEPVDPGKLVGIGFNRTDCESFSITFPDISTGYLDDENNAGPYIMCNLSVQGAHGSIQASMYITSFQPDKLEGYYQDQKSTIKVYVDQSTEWNADPAVPDEAKDVISILYDDIDGYVFMITSEANVQNCYQGRGYGTLILFDKYLANMQYVSCELGDTAAYVAVMQQLQTMATGAVLSVEAKINTTK